MTPDCLPVAMFSVANRSMVPCRAQSWLRRSGAGHHRQHRLGPDKPGSAASHRPRRPPCRPAAPGTSRPRPGSCWPAAAPGRSGRSRYATAAARRPVGARWPTRSPPAGHRRFSAPPGQASSPSPSSRAARSRARHLATGPRLAPSRVATAISARRPRSEAARMLLLTPRGRARRQRPGGTFSSRRWLRRRQREQHRYPAAP
jgi:hypothetical protein